MNFRTYPFKIEEREQLSERSSLCTSFNFRYDSTMAKASGSLRAEELLNTSLWGSPKRRMKPHKARAA